MVITCALQQAAPPKTPSDRNPQPAPPDGCEAQHALECTGGGEQRALECTGGGASDDYPEDIPSPKEGGTTPSPFAGVQIEADSEDFPFPEGLFFGFFWVGVGPQSFGECWCATSEKDFRKSFSHEMHHILPFTAGRTLLP